MAHPGMRANPPASRSIRGLLAAAGVAVVLAGAVCNGATPADDAGDRAPTATITAPRLDERRTDDEADVRPTAALPSPATPAPEPVPMQTPALSVNLEPKQADSEPPPVETRIDDMPGRRNASDARTVVRAVPDDCSLGAVPNPEAHPGLVGDCRILLQLRDVLVVDGSLNWSAVTPMSRWDAIHIDGTPPRVRGLYVFGGYRGGMIPPELGSLTGLRYLDIIANASTGAIPRSSGS